MTSSRHREDAATIFDVFCEIGAPDSSEKLAPMLTKYPEDFNDPSVLKSIQQFAFPCSMKNNSDNDAVQLFSFVLTDSNSKYSYGFCRYTPRNDTCICLLSAFFWPNVFHKALNEISLLMNAGSQSDLDSILTHLYHTDIPGPGDTISFVLARSNQKFEVKIPSLAKLPTLCEDKYMLEFYNAVSPRQLIALFASLLKERRIIFTGKKLSQLSSCVHSCSKLLNPMSWQSVFIPVLPMSLTDMVMAPMPYILGVPKMIMDIKKLRDIGDVVVIDVDEKTLESPFDDVAAMPNEVVSFLKTSLKATIDMNDSFAKMFLRAMVILFGDYRSGFVKDDSGVVTFNNEKYVSMQKATLQPYLSSLLGADGVQYLERFLHDRVDCINKGEAILDRFEVECAKMEKSRMVRENANDVIGALKDKVSGIQFLHKLTPNEIKRAAARRRFNPIEFQAMSFENHHWDKTSSDSSSDTSPSKTNKDGMPILTPNMNTSVNLIDFDSPLPSQEKREKHDPTDFLRPTTIRNLNDGSQKNFNVFADPFTLLDTPITSTGPTTSHVSNSPSASSSARIGWEKFD